MKIRWVTNCIIFIFIYYYFLVTFRVGSYFVTLVLYCFFHIKKEIIVKVFVLLNFIQVIQILQYVVLLRKIKTIKGMKHEKLLLSPQVLRNCYTSRYLGKYIHNHWSFHFNFFIIRLYTWLMFKNFSIIKLFIYFYLFFK